MRITFILGPFLPVPPVLGGAVEKVAFEICHQLAKRGHDVVIVSRALEGFAADEVVDGVRHVRVPSFSAPRSKVLYRVLDVIYALRAAKAAPASDITVTNSVSLPLLLDGRKAGAIYVNVGRFPKGQLKLYSKAARLQAVSTTVGRAIVEQSPPLAEKVKVVPNCISDVFVELANAPRHDRDKIILYSGRISEEKGIHFLVEAFSTFSKGHPDWRLQILGPWKSDQGGDGEVYIKRLRRIAAAAPGAVEFLEPIFDEKALSVALNRAEIFAYPSIARTGETFGVAVLEAMAAGCATIVSDLDCFLDFVTPDANGLVVSLDEDPVAQLAAQLSRLADAAPLRESLGAAGKATALRYSARHVAELFEADFQSLLAAQ